MSATRTIRLGDVAQPLDRFEQVEPDSSYALLGMRSKIGGPFIRETKRGSELSAKKLNRVKAGDFIYSRLFAWQGSFGIIPEDLDGCFVSNEFPIFEIDEESLHPKYLLYWFGLPHTQKVVEADCMGSTPGTRNRYKVEFFSELTLDVPEIGRQEMIATKIDSVLSKIDAARSLYDEIRAESSALLVAMAHRNDLNDTQKERRGWKLLKLGEVLSRSVEPVDVEPGVQYPHFGIYSFSKGLFKKAHLEGSEIKAKKLYRIRERQFIYGRLNAYEGAFATVTGEFDRHYVSNEFPTFDCDETKVYPEFLAAYFSTPVVWEALKRKVTGIGGGAGNRRIRLKEEVLLSEEVWIPPLEWQDQIRFVEAKKDDLHADQQSGQLILDALVPAVLDHALKGNL